MRKKIYLHCRVSITSSDHKVIGAEMTSEDDIGASLFANAFRRLFVQKKQ